MRKLFGLVLGLIIFCVLLTFIILWSEVEKDKDKVEESGKMTYEDAYITSCDGGRIIFVADGEEYVSPGELVSPYIGKAKIETVNGRIKKVYAICEEKVKASDEQQDKIKQDSETELNGNINIDCINVLLKNNNSIYHKDIRMIAEDVIEVGEFANENKFVASDYFEGNNSKNVYINNSSKVEFNNKKYEGNFKIYKAKKGYVVVNELPIEKYIKYVLPSEMPTTFHLEALKSQAVCARTFAYAMIENPAYPKWNADLDDTTVYQVYNASGKFDVTDKAVEETTGKIIANNNKLICCYYFSTSSGETEDMTIWGSKTPKYIQSVKSEDKNSPYYRWTATINCSAFVNSDYGKLKNLKVIKKSKHGYVIRLKAIYENGQITISDENKIRNFLEVGVESLLLADGQNNKNPKIIPSACFTISEKENGKYYINGAGFGHDIGLSQYGADMLADEGLKYDSIIKYYYKNVEIKDVSEIY